MVGDDAVGDGEVYGFYLIIYQYMVAGDFAVEFEAD